MIKINLNVETPQKFNNLRLKHFKPFLLMVILLIIITNFRKVFISFNSFIIVNYFEDTRSRTHNFQLK